MNLSCIIVCSLQLGQDTSSNTLLNHPPQPWTSAQTWAQLKMPNGYVSTAKRSQVIYRENK